MPTSEVARAFGIGVSSVKRYAAAHREGRSLAPQRRPGSKPKLGETARSLLVAGGIDARRFVSVDGCSTNTALAPLHAWSRRGERAFGRAPRNRGSNVTLLASMGAKSMGPCVAVEGPTTRAAYGAYLEQELVPAPEPGRVVVMDNLSSHKGGRVKEIVEGAGCEVAYLPPEEIKTRQQLPMFANPLPNLSGICCCDEATPVLHNTGGLASKEPRSGTFPSPYCAELASARVTNGDRIHDLRSYSPSVPKKPSCNTKSVSPKLAPVRAIPFS